MKFAIPVKKGRGLDSLIDTSFSECHRLLLVVTDDEQLELSHIAFSGRPGDCNDIVARMLEENVEAAVFGHISQAQIEALADVDIDVYVGAQGTVREALCRILDGRLETSMGRNLCTTNDL